MASDYFEMCHVTKPAFVEVKEHCGQLSKTKKATKAVVTKIGFDYRTERCSLSC